MRYDELASSNNLEAAKSPIIEITKDLFFVGCHDPHLKIFDIIMYTDYGTTYNAYLLKTSEGVILSECVKDKFFEDYLNRVQSLCSLDDIKYIIVNHTEPDHVGAVRLLLEKAPHITVVGSPIAIKYIGNMINAPFNSKVVKDGEELTLGDKTIRFISVPQLHWPDSMYSYIVNNKALLTCDSFGAHYSDYDVLISKLPEKNLEAYKESYKYYFDMIMGPFKPFVQKALAKIKDLDIDCICPGHGMILDDNSKEKYIALYDEWSKPVTKTHPQIIIAYVSAYGYTKTMAEAIAEGIKESSYSGDVTMFNLESDKIDDVLAVLPDADGLLLGTPTILAEALPPILQLLACLNPVMHKSITMGAFGSYGWSGEGPIHVQERLKQLKAPIPLEPLCIEFKPSEDQIEKAVEFGKNFAESLR